MDLNDVLDEIAGELDTINGLRVFGYPPDRVEPPAAIVAYPDDITFDETYGRGMDRMTVPVLIVVGKVSDRASRTKLAGFCAGSGTSSVKQVLEAGTYTAFDTLRVMSGIFDVVRIAGIDYAAVLFDVDIAGQGDIS